MISRAEAARIGEAEILSRGLGTGVGKVILSTEVTGRPPLIYGGPDFDDCWIVYAEQPIIGLRSSVIVLVSRESGDIRYVGSAHDEG